MPAPRIPAQVRTINPATEQIRIVHAASAEEFVIQLIGGGKQRIRLQGPHSFEFTVEPRDIPVEFLPKDPPLTP